MSDAVLVSWHQAVPSRRRLVRPVVVGALTAAVLATALGVAAGLAALKSLHPAAALPVPPPEWIDIARPFHLYDLAAPDLRSLTLVYSARRRPADKGREDVLAFGVPGVDPSSLRVRIVRHPSDATTPPLFAATARQVAEAGLSVDRSSLADVMPTRFGRFEIVELTLKAANGSALPCSGFRLQSRTPGLTIGGFACGLPGKPTTRAALACMIDRLDLVAGGDDRELVDFFAASEAHRDANCTGARLAPDKLHAAWLDDKPVTHRKTPHRR